jgi:hypothetical protein
MTDPRTGACPPSGIFHDLKVAKEFDKKGKKWFGKTAVGLYYEEHPEEMPWWMKFTSWLRRRPWARVYASGYISANEENQGT